MDAVWDIDTGGRRIHFFRPSQINRPHMGERMFLATVISRSRNLTADVLIAKVRCRCCVLCPTRVEDLPFRYRFYSHLSCLNGSRLQDHDIWRSSRPVRNHYFRWGTPGRSFNFPSVYYSTNFRYGQTMQEIFAVFDGVTLSLRSEELQRCCYVADPAGCL